MTLTTSTKLQILFISSSCALASNIHRYIKVYLFQNFACRPLNSKFLISIEHNCNFEIEHTTTSEYVEGLSVKGVGDLEEPELKFLHFLLAYT